MSVKEGEALQSRNKYLCINLSYETNQNHLVSAGGSFAVFLHRSTKYSIIRKQSGADQSE